MELEEFIEQDIILFLDERLETAHLHNNLLQKTPLTPVSSHDYETEFFIALDNKDITNAKQILASLKAEFDACPTNDPEKPHLKSLLIDLYEKFKDYLDAEHTFATIEQKLEPSATEAKEHNTTITATTPMNTTTSTTTTAITPITPKIAAPLTTTQSTVTSPEITQPTPPATTTQLATPATIISLNTKRINELLHTLEETLKSPTAQSVQQAVTNYREIKRLALQEQQLDEKQAQQIIAMHQRIEATMETLQRSKTRAQQERIEKKIEKNNITTNPTNNNPPMTNLMSSAPTNTTPHNDILTHLQQLKKELDGAVQRHDLQNAKSTYKNMRLLAQQLQNTPYANDVHKKMVRIFDSLKEMETHLSKNDTSLSKAIP